MKLFVHLLTHLILSLFVGFIMWRASGSAFVFAASLMSGLFIDIDHFIDYFLAFGTKFNFVYFLKGYSFLKTDKIYVFFHSWELVIILLLVMPIVALLGGGWTIVFFLLSFSLSLFFHLTVDVFTNAMLPQSYFVTYRLMHKFDLKTMVTKSHYIKHLDQKKSSILSP
ncbi:MAG: hypothetical protein V1652_00565 [bacterium]